MSRWFYLHNLEHNGDGNENGDDTIPPLPPASKEFIESSLESTHTLLHLRNIPSGLPSHTIASTLRPILPIADYTQDVHFIDPHHALTIHNQSPLPQQKHVVIDIAL